MLAYWDKRGVTCGSSVVFARQWGSLACACVQILAWLCEDSCTAMLRFACADTLAALAGDGTDVGLGIARAWLGDLLVHLTRNVKAHHSIRQVCSVAT